MYTRVISSLLLTAIAFVSTGCASKPRELKALETPLPMSEAVFESGASEQDGFILAARLMDDDEQDKYLSDDVDSEDFLPVLVTLTNKSRRRVVSKSLEAKLLADDKAYERAPLRDVYEELFVEEFGPMMLFTNVLFLGLPAIEGANARKENLEQLKNEAIRNNFFQKSLVQRVVEPGQTINGLVFYEEPSDDDDMKLQLPIQFLDHISELQLEANVIVD